MDDLLDKLTIISYNRAEVAIGDLMYFIPDIQRQQCNEHVDRIYNTQKAFHDKHKFYLINGTISIVIVGENEYLIDGMHRVAAYTKLRNENAQNKIILHVDYYTCKSDTDVEILYKYVNSSKPNIISKMTIESGKILQYASKFLSETFSEYIKKSNNPYKPYISIAKFESYVDKNKIIERAQIKSGKEFVDHIIKLNTFYSTISESQFEVWDCADPRQSLKKIRSHSNCLYLGIYTKFEWLDRIVDSVQYNLPYDKIYHLGSMKGRYIGHELRKAVWGSSLCEGKCYCCDAAISVTRFECGHVIPYSAGGSTTLENLKPICIDCNRDMGTRNLEFYKQLIISQR